MSSWTNTRLCLPGQACHLHILLLLHLAQLVSSGDVKRRKELYTPDYKIYHNLSALENHITQIASLHPSYITVDKSYRSLQNRPQLVLRITDFEDIQISHAPKDVEVPKVKILLSFGEHAREFLPVEYLLYFLKNITQGISAPKSSYAEVFSRTILSRVDLFVVAMMNPDGRKHIEETGNYCWRGTSTGVDLNRNFNWQFGRKGSSNDRNDEEYRGPHAFSEPEGKVLEQLTTKYAFDAFMSLHSGIRQIYVPFADTYSRRLGRKPWNLEAMLDLAKQMAHATPARFSYGLAYQLNDYTADGAIFDFMAGIRKIPFSYAVELWGEGDHEGAQCFDLFNPDSADLQAVLGDIHPMFETLFKYMVNWKYKQVVMQEKQKMNAHFGHWGSMLLLIIVVLLILMMAVPRRLYHRLRPSRRCLMNRLCAISSAFAAIIVVIIIFGPKTLR